MLKKYFLYFAFFLLLILDLLILFYNITEKYKILVIPGITVSIISIFIAGDIFLDVSYKFGNNISISSKSVGLFIVGFASIIDELSMSIIAAFENLGSISFGAIQGSNIITLIAFFIIIPIFYRKGIKNFRIDSYLILITSIIIYILSLFIIKIPFYIGFITLFIFIFYILIINKQEANEKIIEKSDNDYSYYYGLFSVIIIIIASYNMVNSAYIIADVFKINSFLSSFFLLGFFGSMPEIVMMVIAAKRNREDVSIGLITGSTLYKETVVFSLAAFIGTLTFYNSFFSIITMIIFSVLLVIYTVLFR